MRAGTLQQLSIRITLILLALLMFYPFYFMLQTSLKDDSQFALQFWIPTAPFHWENYAQAFAIIWRYIVNSGIVVGSATLAILAIATLAAYPLARLRFAGRELLYYTLIAMLMVPGILLLVPQFVLIRDLHLIGTYPGVILPYIAGGLTAGGNGGGIVLSLFILRAFFASLPEELFEAARIDGASEWRVFLRVAVPLVRPALASVAILQVLTYWNDYVWPLLVLTDDSMKTLVVGLVAFQTRYSMHYGPQMAGYTIGSVPLLLLFVFGVRQFVTGLTAGALKL